MRCVRCGAYVYGPRPPGWAIIRRSPDSDTQLEVIENDELGRNSTRVFGGLCPKCVIPPNVALNNGLKPPAWEICP